MKILLHFGPLSSTLPLTEALKLGTVQTSTSSGKGIMKGQTQNFEIYLIENRCSTSTFHNSCTNWARSSYCTLF